MNDDLQTLLAKQAITEQLYNYCRSFDRLDDALALSVWHEDGTVQYANGPVQALTEYLPPSTGYRSTLLNCSHQISNILIKVRADKAISEAYVTASLQEQPDANKQMAENLYRGRYIDQWSFRGGKWAIEHRQFLPDSFTRIEFTNAFAGSTFLEMAKRDKTDPSYAAFDALE
jgi:hypothetical protein